MRCADAIQPPVGHPGGGGGGGAPGAGCRGEELGYDDLRPRAVATFVVAKRR